MARAINSLPVPVSPRMSTVESVGDTFETCDSTRRSTSDEPTISSNMDDRTMSSQRERLVAQSVFAAPAILDVGTRRVPANDVSSFVSQRIVVNQVPTILTIPAAHSSFVLEWDPSRDRRIAFVAQSLEILRMKDLTKAPRSHALRRQSGVVHYCLIRVQKCAVGPNSDDALRYCIDDRSKLSFGFGDFLESPR